MKRNIWDLVWAILALLIAIFNLIKFEETANLIGFEINAWIYRGLWLLVSGINFYKYFKGASFKKDKNLNSKI